MNHESQPDAKFPQPVEISLRCSRWTFALFPGIAMLLGWGLRGYIGGGPFGAMIPGCFLALSLSILLRHDRGTAAVMALFGAIGIGYGGEMTYGQTLGLACKSETLMWGFLGVTVKGAVWGLLGGAVLGVGLTLKQYKRFHVFMAFGLTVLFFLLGWKLINEPRWIYFSDPINKPRDESWAGLLLAALVFLTYLKKKGTREQGHIPLRFALWGALGGGFGFGAGTIFLALGPHLPVPQQWFGWWKAMEFFFGLALGVVYGLCAYGVRQELVGNARENTSETKMLLPGLALLILMIVFFCAFPLLESMREEPVWQKIPLLNDLFRVLYTFVFFGAVCIFLGLKSNSLAWQIAVTITFFHTVFDLGGDAASTFGIEISTGGKMLILAVVTAAMAVLVQWFQRQSQAIPRLYLLVLWSCYGVACIRTFAHKGILQGSEGIVSGLRSLVESHPAIVPVHLIFTVSAIITTVYILRLVQSGNEP